MASLSSCIFPYAQARPPRQRIVRRSSNKKQTGPRKPTPDLKLRSGKKSLTSVIGVEATTYTRLPPKDDFSLPSLAAPTSIQFSREVRLSDAAAAAQVRRESETPVDGVEVGEDDEEGGGVNEWENYAKFEVFEVSGEEDESEGDSEDEEEDVKEIEKLRVLDSASAAGETGEDEEEEYEWENYGKFEVFEVNGDVNEAETEAEAEDGDEEISGKEKGVPAVMRCFDRAKIYARAGDGGNGVVAFRREKFVPLGGPSGGDGGRGGNVYVEVDGSMNSLLPFRNSVHFRAGRGSHGQGKMQAGAKGEDAVIKVAPGTIFRQAGTDEVLLELLHPGQRGLLLPGGRGGRGNASFKSGANKVPRIAENGEEGPEMWLELELKLVADVGIVGAPNAGKSTLLGAISAAQPAIANYPFTTLLPNLGVVSFDYDSTMVVADLPGLLEGAHRGFGLGHEFLRHTERCSSLVHVVDGSSQQPELEFEAVRLELELFSPEIADKPYVVAFNKMDLPEARENWPSFQKSLRARGVEPMCMSAVLREGSHEIICAAHKLLRERRESEENFNGMEETIDMNHVADMVRKQRTASINEFEVSHDSSTNTWNVSGTGLQRFVQMTNWRYLDSDRRFQHVLDACGVNKSLIKLGVKEGDTVIVGEMEMEWHDAADSSRPANMRRRSSVSDKWAEWK